VAGGHGVGVQGVGEVAADGEAVDHKPLLVHEHGDNLLHHLQVGGGPDLLQLQPLAQGVVVITHVGVRFVPVVIIIEVVVKSKGGVARLAELIAQGEGHVVLGGQGVAPHPGFWDQAGGGDILPVGGGQPP